MSALRAGREPTKIELKKKNFLEKQKALGVQAVDSWDVIMVYRLESEEDEKWIDLSAKEKQKLHERNEHRTTLLNRLMYSKLLVSISLSRTEEEVYIKIAATEDRLDDSAEQTGMEMKLNDEFKDPVTGIAGYADFTKQKMKLGYFRGAGYYNENTGEFQPNGQLFSSLERQRLIFHILEDKMDHGGAEIDIDKWKREGILLACFPMHDEDSRRHLDKVWVRSFFKEQPLDDIRDYFGEKYALYFAWLGFYTRMLVYPAVLGTMVFIYGFDHTVRVDGTEVLVGADNKLVPSYCVFLSLWSTCFLELWKRYNAELAYKWDVMDFEEEEKARPEFLDSTRTTDVHGVWSAGGIFFEIPPGDPLEHKMKDLDKEVPLEKVMPDWKRGLYYLFSISCILPAVSMVVIGTLSILFFRGVMQVLTTPHIGAAIGGVMNATFIGIGNGLYKKLAVYLNDLETHRTDTTYEDALILKCFFFQFINSYISLFYIAFGKSNEIHLFGERDWCHDMTNSGENFLKSPEEIKMEPDNYGYNPHCMHELFTQLMTLVVFAQLVGQIQELFMPLIKAKIKIHLENIALKKKQFELLEEKYSHEAMLDEEEAKKMRKREAEKLLVPLKIWEKEAKLEEAEGTFDEYNEMIIQYGYVTLFAAAFPVASLASLINNFIEMRSDASVLVNMCQRPQYQGAEDIGSWYKILEIQSTVAVLTNVCLLGFTSATLKLTYFVNETDSERMKYKVLWTVILLEHVVLFVKFALAEIIPDIPEKIVQAIARQEFEKELMLQWMEQDGGSSGEDYHEDILEKTLKLEFDRTYTYGDIAEFTTPAEEAVGLSQKERREAARLAQKEEMLGAQRSGHTAKTQLHLDKQRLDDLSPEEEERILGA